MAPNVPFKIFNGVNNEIINHPNNIDINKKITEYQTKVSTLRPKVDELKKKKENYIQNIKNLNTFPTKLILTNKKLTFSIKSILGTESDTNIDMTYLNLENATFIKNLHSVLSSISDYY